MGGRFFQRLENLVGEAVVGQVCVLYEEDLVATFCRTHGHVAHDGGGLLDTQHAAYPIDIALFGRGLNQAKVHMIAVRHEATGTTETARSITRRGTE